MGAGWVVQVLHLLLTRWADAWYGTWKIFVCCCSEDIPVPLWKQSDSAGAAKFFHVFSWSTFALRSVNLKGREGIGAKQQWMVHATQSAFTCPCFVGGDRPPEGAGGFHWKAISAKYQHSWNSCCQLQLLKPRHRRCDPLFISWSTAAVGAGCAAAPRRFTRRSSVPRLARGQEGGSSSASRGRLSRSSPQLLRCLGKLGQRGRGAERAGAAAGRCPTPAEPRTARSAERACSAPKSTASPLDLK